MNYIFWSSICFLGDLVAVSDLGWAVVERKTCHLVPFSPGLSHSVNYRNYLKLRVIEGAISDGIAATGISDRDQSWFAARRQRTLMSKVCNLLIKRIFLGV